MTAPLDRLSEIRGWPVRIIHESDSLVPTLANSREVGICIEHPDARWTLKALFDIAEAASAGHRFPGHDCAPFVSQADEGTTYCTLCEALAALSEQA